MDYEVEETYSQDNKANAWLIVLSVLFPLVGIILSIVYWEEKKYAAKKYLTAALISVGVSVILGIIIPILIFVIFFGTGLIIL